MRPASAGRVRSVVQGATQLVHKVEARVDRWPERRRPVGRDVVLNFHQVRPLSVRADNIGMVVPPELFRAQLEAVATVYDVVPAAEIRAIRPTTAGRPRAAVTLDDGYLDNLDVALPVLAGLGLPATFFIPTDALADDGEFWWDRLGHLLEDESRNDPVEVDIAGQQHVLDLSSEDGRVGAVQLANHLLMRVHPSAVEEVLSGLEEQLGRSPAACQWHRRMDADQVSRLAERPGVEVGSHTCSHAPLGRLSRRDSAQELRRSRAVLTEVLGAAPPLIAYPYGANGTVRRRDARAAAAAGYVQAFANVPGPTEGSDPYAVPRCQVGLEEPEDLLRRLATWAP